MNIYYEQEDLWSRNYLSITDEKIRIEEILKNIPIELESLLDVGCGNGAFLNTISQNPKFKYLKKTIGIDMSNEALKYVLTEKKQGLISNIPYRDRSFEMVTSLEVLEHIKVSEFCIALKELGRVSNKYILLTVPNNENLDLNLRICPQCKCHFHPYNHVRSFTKEALSLLFSEYNFKCERIIEIGPTIRTLKAKYFSLRKLFYPLKPKSNHICPQCDYKGHEKSSSNGSSQANDIKILRRMENLIFGKKQTKWILALYKRTLNE